MTRDLAKTVVTVLAALGLLCVITSGLAGDNVPGLVTGVVLYAAAGLIAFRSGFIGSGEGTGAAGDR